MCVCHAYSNAATTIVSGSVTSRIKFSAYMASCVVLSGFTFPVMVYWTWYATYAHACITYRPAMRCRGTCRHGMERYTLHVIRGRGFLGTEHPDGLAVIDFAVSMASHNIVYHPICVVLVVLVYVLMCMSIDLTWCLSSHM